MNIDACCDILKIWTDSFTESHTGTTPINLVIYDGIFNVSFSSNTNYDNAAFSNTGFILTWECIGDGVPWPGGVPWTVIGSIVGTVVIIGVIVIIWTCYCKKTNANAARLTVAPPAPISNIADPSAAASDYAAMYVPVTTGLEPVEDIGDTSSDVKVISRAKSQIQTEVTRNVEEIRATENAILELFF